MRVEPTVFGGPEAVGRALASLIADRLAEARPGTPFLLGCPSGRSPSTYVRPSSARSRPRARSGGLVIVMMDEYVEDDGTGSAAVDPRRRTAAPVRPRGDRRAADRRRRPGPRDRARPLLGSRPARPRRYDAGSPSSAASICSSSPAAPRTGTSRSTSQEPPRHARTHVVDLAESTRRDNLGTFPTFGQDLDRVPRRGVTVGVGTIRDQSKEVVMVVHGAHKATAVRRRARPSGTSRTGRPRSSPSAHARSCSSTIRDRRLRPPRPRDLARRGDHESEETNGSHQDRVSRRRLVPCARHDGVVHPSRQGVRRLALRADRSRPRPPRDHAPHLGADDQGGRSRHHRRGDDRPARRPHRRRLRAVQLPSRQLRGTGDGRADPAEVRRDRPGDTGPRRADDVAALRAGHEAALRDASRGRTEGPHLQLHEPGQHRVAGRGRQHRASRSCRSARDRSCSRRSSRRPPASTPTSCTPT